MSWPCGGPGRATGIGYVLQTGGLVPFLSVAENVLLTRRLLGLPCPGSTPALLAELGIGELVRRLPRQISIGERQRVAIARALAHRPALIRGRTDGIARSGDGGNDDVTADLSRAAP